MKLRDSSEGGGVAIITHNKVKSVHLKEFDVDGLEAIWADVKLGKVRTVVGSVYIPPGDTTAIYKLDTVIGRILQSHAHLVIGMDANARSNLWDDSCIGISNHVPSFQMGLKLEAGISKYDLLIHNDGRSTYSSGMWATAPDVTLSKGITEYGPVSWSITDDDLRSPHECILLNIGENTQPSKVTVVDWPKFCWSDYERYTETSLRELRQKWENQREFKLNDMVDDFGACIHHGVDKTASWRVVTKHSKPWIDSEISDRFKELRKLKRKCRLRRSPANVAKYTDFLEETTSLVKEAEHRHWLAQCNMLSTIDDRKKWKLIHSLSNLQSSSGVQPIRTSNKGNEVYLFEDYEIIAAMEDHHIRKVDRTVQDSDYVVDSILEMIKSARSGSGNNLMNAPISDYEVKSTFGTGSDTPGPDEISAKLIDRANRDEMHKCLLFLWNKAWDYGYFIDAWKKENRVIIPKPGKDDYHKCDAYRTVSVTSCLGKRFERITSQRLTAVFEDTKFDSSQFAYLKNRSCTQALLVLTERVKNSLIAGGNAGVVFFDFTDAFGSVDRNLLLFKLGRDFGISGRLFLHINSFLSNRLSRINTDGMVGDWTESLFGTSAGTILGPLLFIGYINDVPKSISPKFADDFVAVSVNKDSCAITLELQRAIDDLVAWSDEWGMELNVAKTKVMFFGSKFERLAVNIKNTTIEQVISQKYLGVVLDPLLSFSLQADYATGKAKRAAAKVSALYRGRDGIAVHIGVHLYKSLIRPHLEYAIPVWAAISDKDMSKLEQTQAECLKKVIGAKVHSSSAAVEVITGVMPIKIRMRELCCREFIRIRAKDKSHQLQELLRHSSRVGLRFSPLEYISVMSKQLEKSMGTCFLEGEVCISESDLLHVSNISSIEICAHGSSSIRNSSDIEKEEYRASVNNFIQSKRGKSVVIFTDGSVHNISVPVGCAACAAVLLPINDDEGIITDTYPVGTNVDSLTCEIHGIILGLQLAAKYFRTSTVRQSKELLYVLCDCSTAIDMIVRRSLHCKTNLLRMIHSLEKELLSLNVTVYISWIPGHIGIEANEMADTLAKELSADIYKGRVSAPCHISINSALTLSANIANKSWQRKWDLDPNGYYTKHLIPKVGTKISFPTDRSIGITYCRLLLHDTMLNDDSHRTGTSDSPVCECGVERESADHFLLHCNRYEQARNVMIQTVKDIWFLSQPKRTLNISEHLLLAPCWNNCFTQKYDGFIKDALFQFLADVNRKL